MPDYSLRENAKIAKIAFGTLTRLVNEPFHDKLVIDWPAACSGP